MHTRRSLLVSSAAAFALSPLAAFAKSVNLGSHADINIGSDADAVCTLTCSQILGPCYYSPVQVRRDITEGSVGLPMLLSFQVVNADTCQPIANASVDIWHTDRNGVYSAPIAAICNPGDAGARQKTFLRGVQMTDSSGWAHFNSVFPGWYSGRTVHIHATVRIDNTAAVTTQFYFDDALSESIYRNHPAYAARPNRDTTNARDGVLGGSLSRMAPYILSTKLIDDRALAARKVLAVRTPTRCTA